MPPFPVADRLAALVALLRALQDQPVAPDAPACPWCSAQRRACDCRERGDQ